MARIMKKGLEFYSVEIGLWSTIAYRMVSRKFGSKSCLIYMLLLDLLHRENGYYIAFDGMERQGILLDLCDRLRCEDDVDEGLVLEIIEYFVQMGIFDAAQYEKGVITSHQAQETYFRATERRKHVRVDLAHWILTEQEMMEIYPNHNILCKLREEKSTDCGSADSTVPNAAFTVPNVDKSAQSKAKESKAKESKAKESKEKESTAQKTETESKEQERIKNLQQQSKEQAIAALWAAAPKTDLPDCSALPAVDENHFENFEYSDLTDCSALSADCEKNKFEYEEICSDLMDTPFVEKSTSNAYANTHIAPMDSHTESTKSYENTENITVSLAQILQESIDPYFTQEIDNLIAVGMEKALILHAARLVMGRNPANACGYLRSLLRNYHQQRIFTLAQLTGQSTPKSAKYQNKTPQSPYADPHNPPPDAPLEQWEIDYVNEVKARNARRLREMLENDKENAVQTA